MPFLQADSLRYYTFDSLDNAGVTHAVFTRQGGVSPQPWASLNLGGTVGDEPARVAENRHRAFRSVDRHLETLYDVWQVHSADVVCAVAPRPRHVPHRRADILLTNRPEVTLMMRFGDCVPILLYDPDRRVVGIVHAGWPGTVKRASQVAVRTMQSVYGSNPINILAAIGPSIGAHHYEVGPEVIEKVRQTFGEDASYLLPSQEGAVQFDLWAANQLVLEESGVRQIEISGICTACHLEDWYSHRAEGGRTGRFGALIGLRE